MSAFRKSAAAAAAATGSAVRFGWKIGPAAAGMGALSVAVGGLVQTFAGQGGLYSGLAVAGIFALAIDLKG